MEYTLSLALEDYIPVLLSSAGLFIIARMVAGLNEKAGRMAYLGLALIAVGGLLKATWKLVLAGSGRDIVWMDQALFPLLGPGFTLMAWAVWNGQQVLRGQAVQERMWLRPLILIGVIAFAALLVGGTSWRFVFLALLTLANVSTLILLIWQARRQGQNGAIVGFILNLVMIFMLTGMARIENQTVGLQWMEQILNTFSQAGFCYACWRLAQSTNQAVRRAGVATAAW